MPVKSLRSLRPACFVLGVGLIAYAGCSSSGGAAVAVTHPTMIEVAPAQFLGAVPCTVDEPGLKKYVATLYDTNETAEGGAPSDFQDKLDELAGETTATALERLRGDAPSGQFELPSSAPAPCSASVGFGSVVPGRLYEVLIDGYETEDIVPRALGSHLMVSGSRPDGPLVRPSFQAYCGRAIAVDSTVVVADHCDTFTPSLDAPAPSLRVPVGALLGSFACGTEAGQVEQLRVTLQVTDGESYEQLVDCSPTAEAVFEELPAAKRASVYVAGLEAGSDEPPLAGATCDALLVQGERVTARCNRLSSVGTLSVDVVAALAQLGLICSDTSVSTVQLQVLGSDAPPVTLSPPECLQSFEAGFPAGPAEVTLSATSPEKGTLALICHAEIAPGKLTLAECDDLL